MKTRSETFVQFTLEEGKDREAFIQEFTQVVSSLRASSNDESVESIVEVLESSTNHVRVKKREDS